CVLFPPRLRPGRWVTREADAVRSVSVFETGSGTGAGGPLAWYATSYAGVPAVELTLVVTGNGGPLPEALGVAVEAADPAGARAGAVEPESRPEEPQAEEQAASPAFEDVIEDLRRSAWDAVPVEGSAVQAAVRRHGPASPIRIERGASRPTVFLALEPSESL